VAGFAENLSTGIDDCRLDLRPAKIDTAAQISHAPQSMPLGLES
jgi:hypothetical protein